MFRGHEKLMKHCSLKNSPEFNKDKALEEAAEFMEAVLKRQTKHKDNPKKPKKDELLKEYGDFIYRGFIYLMQENPEITQKELMDAVKNHIGDKLTLLQGYKDDNKYDNGL